jgi:D-arabinose 1-dehydrogenase-like Zn-dependent alcohol dehydrogenase
MCQRGAAGGCGYARLVANRMEIVVRAVVFEQFGGLPHVVDVPPPAAADDGVVIRVEASGLCRSDIHGWQGHDDSIALPHVPGHELVGRIESVGRNVRRFSTGQRVTTPFVCACGACPECLSGNGQVCRNQTQPGFTHWGSYAELVAVRNADINLIEVPDTMDAAAAALLGCRFATAYRGVIHQGRLQAGEGMLVVGAGGVGLSCVMIGKAIGATVIAVDVSDAALASAQRLGADHVINSRSRELDDVVAEIARAAGGGVQVSVDALGREETLALGIHSLARRGRHVQIGLFADEPRFPMSAVIARELELRGSHGMRAADYADLLALVEDGSLHPEAIVTKRIGLDEVPNAMEQMNRGELRDVTLIEVSEHPSTANHPAR